MQYHNGVGKSLTYGRDLLCFPFPRFFDLLSLTQPRAMQIINTNQPAKRNVLQQMDEVGHTVETHDPGSFPGRKSIRETPGHILFQSQVSNPYQSASSTSDTTGLSNDLGTRSYLSPSSVNPGLVALPDRSSLLAQEVAICQALTGLTNKQRQICLQHSGLVWAMLEGTRLGLHECVYQFKHEQWNCSAVNILYQLQTNSASIPKVSGLEGILQRGEYFHSILFYSHSASFPQLVFGLKYAKDKAPTETVPVCVIEFKQKGGLE